MRFAFLASLFLITAPTLSNAAETTSDQRTVCGQITISDTKDVRLVRRAIYQPGTGGGYGAGRIYRLVKDEAGPALDVLRKYDGKFVCVRGFDYLESEDWLLSVSAIAD